MVYWSRVLPLLRPCVFLRDELVCLQGDECIEAFVLTSGRLVASTLVDAGALKETDYAPALASRLRRFEASAAGAVAEADKFSEEFVRCGDIDRSSSDGEAVVEHDAGKLMRLRMRVVEPGGMVNILCALKVTSKSGEMVRACGKADCYALDSDALISEFDADKEVGPISHRPIWLSLMHNLQFLIHNPDHFLFPYFYLQIVIQHLTLFHPLLMLMQVLDEARQFILSTHFKMKRSEEGSQLPRYQLSDTEIQVNMAKYAGVSATLSEKEA
jgi:hypothetical protein